MSKNTNISELINYLSYDGSGNIVFTTVSSAASNTDKFLVSDAGVLKFRTAAQLLSDIGAQASGSYQAALSGTGFVKISGSTISYDNSTYATETYVGTAISNLVVSSPATLDTLNELALALGSDPNFATTVATSIGTKQAQLNGTGFVKITGTTISYDNSTYALDSAVVKLAGSQTITGAKTFTQRITTDEGLILKDLGSATYITPSSGYGGISYNNTVAGYSRYYFSENNGSTSILNFPTTVSSKVYTYPNASGILALTSDIPTNNNVLTNGAGYITSSALSGYLPLSGGTLTGALNGTSLGLSNFLTAIATSDIFYGMQIYGSAGSGARKIFVAGKTGFENGFTVDYNGSAFVYAFNSGTTTFGGALSGTSASFTGSISSTSTINILKTSGAIGGQLSYDSNINQLYLWHNVSSGYFSIYTNSTERLTILSGGNVGINNNNPLAKLHVTYAGTDDASVKICGTGGSTNGNFIYSLASDYSDTFPLNVFATNHGSTARTNTLVRIHSNETLNGSLPLRVTAQGTIASSIYEALAVNYLGKVGIGTTNPGYKLTVISDSTAALSVQASNATVGSPILDFYDNGRAQETVITSTDNSTTGTYIASYSNHPLMFGANAGLSPTAKMVIATNGKVGIGESSPDNTYQGLTIKGSDPSLRLKTTGGSGWTWIEFVNSSGTNNFSMGVNQTTPYFGIKAGAGMDSVNFLMNSSGNFGMGDNASSIARLNIGGSTKMNRSFYNWYQGYWTGNSTYWHIKTGMWGGGSPNGNTQYTMSLFKGFYYSYSASILEGAVGFHNWAGTIYALKTTGNLFSNVYISSDGYVVLVIPSGDGETGVPMRASSRQFDF